MNSLVVIQLTVDCYGLIKELSTSLSELGKFYLVVQVIYLMVLKEGSGYVI